ncbi:MAG: alpha/beta fold hydrolase [Lachnospiraceae bacterium]
MVNKTTLSFPSKDGIHTIYATKWQSDDISPIAILQLIHGMAEHIGRYDEFACHMAQKGYIVVGDDHLGHGRSAKEYGDYGYFCEKKAASVLVMDEHRLKEVMQKKEKELPYFMLGHSMGSLILRNYLIQYGQEIDGAILCGTPNNGSVKVGMARIISGLLKLCGKNREKSAFLDRLVFGSYNKRTEKRTCFDWINIDEKVVDEYMNDPQCGFLFTVNGFDTMFQLSANVNKMSLLKRIPKDLPILLIAGKEDPVGNYGKGVAHVYRQYRQLGIAGAELKLYDNARHEILFEPEKDIVFADICNWLQKYI